MTATQTVHIGFVIGLRMVFGATFDISIRYLTVFQPSFWHEVVTSALNLDTLFNYGYFEIPRMEVES